MNRWVSSGLLGMILLTSCSDSSTGPQLPGPLDKLSAVAGEDQVAPAGTELPVALAVRATDKDGKAIAGLLVSFEVVSGGGSFFGKTVMTGATGEARDRWTLGANISAEQRARARAVDPNSGTALEVLFSAIAVAAAPASIHKVSGDEQTGAAGQQLAQALVVQVRDEFGNAVAGATVTWEAGQGGTVSPVSSQTNANGHAQTRWTLGVSSTQQAVTATAGGYQTAFAATAIIAPPGWTPVSDLLQPVRSAAAVTLNGRVHVLGGFGNNYQYTLAHQIYDPVAGSWSYGTPLPVPLDNAAAVVSSKGIHLLGGSTESGATSDHWIYSPVTRQWESAPPLPDARKAAVAWFVNDRIYLFGGLTEETTNSEVAVYDVAAETWSTATPMPTPRYSAAGSWFDGEIVVAGGSGARYEESQLVSAFNPATNTWRELPPMPDNREALGVGTLGNRLCVVGGRVGFSSIRSTVWCLGSGGGWEDVGTMLRPRAEVATAVVDGRLYILGGTQFLDPLPYADRMGPM